MSHAIHRPVLATVALALALPAQIKPGNSIASVTVSTATPQGEMYEIDHQARTAAPLTLSAALANDRPNCLLMLSSGFGFVGSNPVLGGGNVYRIVVGASGVVTETLLNNAPAAGGNVAQLALVGGSVYFTTQNASGTGGILQHVPVGGGAIVVDADLTTIIGWVGLANALAAIGTKVYVAGFDSGTGVTTGSLLEWDTVTNTGTIVLQLPKGKFLSGASTFNTGIVYLVPHPDVPGQLILVGVYGDILYFDTASRMIVRHDWAGFGTGTAGVANLLNAGAWDSQTRDLIVGSRDGHVERICDGHSAEKIVPGVGSSTTPSSNSVNGLGHVPATTQASDWTDGAGCAGNGGYTLTAADAYLPSAGNSGFRFAVYSGTAGHPCVFGVGATNPGLDLTPLGAPGCVMRSTYAIALPQTLSGTGNGDGTASIAFAVPSSFFGVIVHTQWVEVQTITRSNPAGLVVSNGRRLTVR
jgi:hypothetical protein